MKEELIISGRMNEFVDPNLQIWHWPIPLYLYLGGLAAGILFFAGIYYLLGNEKRFPSAIYRAPLIVPALLVVGLMALFYDLSHQLYFWRLYTSFNIQSPMSWGAWTLMIITPVSMVWAAISIKKFWPQFTWGRLWIDQIEAFFISKKSWLAWIMVIFGVLLGVYTGILLSAFNARPLWNTSILGVLFLTSGLSTGAAAIVLFAKDKGERHYFAKLDLMLIGIELFLIIHMFMGFLASTQVQIDAAGLFLGGPYTWPFWGFVVVLGLILPALLEVYELLGKKVPFYIAPLLVLIGGLFLRFIIVESGQISRYLY